jgi:hypothetical protein
MIEPGGYVMLWREEEKANLGVGISRTIDPNADLYEIRVEFCGMMPMREWLRATSRKEATKFAANRYPTATKITIASKNHANQPSRKRVSHNQPTDQG